MRAGSYHHVQQNAGIRHSVGGVDYSTVRAAAFMGLALMSAREAAAHGRPPSLDGRPAEAAKVPLIGGFLGSKQKERCSRLWLWCMFGNMLLVSSQALWCQCWPAMSDMHLCMTCSASRQLIGIDSYCAGGGYVCAIAPSLFEQAHAELLPEVMTGADFLAAHGRHLDTATVVHPESRSAWTLNVYCPIHNLSVGPQWHSIKRHPFVPSLY